MSVFRESKQKSRLTMCTSFSSFGYTMECTRTTHFNRIRDEGGTGRLPPICVSICVSI